VSDRNSTPAAAVLRPASVPVPVEPEAAVPEAVPEAQERAERTVEAAAVAEALGAARAALPAAVPDSGAPPPRPRGTVYQSAPWQSPAAGRRPGRGLPALRVGTHTASATALDLLAPKGSTAGLLLGRDRERRPVAVRLVRPDPTRMAVVGSDWPVRILAFRALALGIRVDVFTTNQERWRGFGEWATGSGGRMRVHPPDGEAVVVEPTLSVYDTGPLGPGVPPEPGPWQTRLTLLRGLTGYGVPVLQEARVALVQRLSAAEAEIVGRTFRMPGPQTLALQAIEPEVVAMVGPASVREVWLTPTAIERRHLGVEPR